MLEEECRSAGVSIFLNTKIQEVTHTTDFVARTSSSEFHAPKLVVATGGLSIPKIGATSFGYDLARQFRLKIVDPWPGLVPLVLEAEDRSRYCDLAGVSAEVIASCNGQQFREKMLFTHRGLSGPAILESRRIGRSLRRSQSTSLPAASPLQSSGIPTLRER